MKKPQFKKPQTLPLLMRRVGQLWKLLWSPLYGSQESLNKLSPQFYSHPVEVTHYSSIDHQGLVVNEEQALRDILLRAHKPLSALVVGCGGGREINAILDSGAFDQVVGVDHSGEMVKKAQAKLTKKGVRIIWGEIQDIVDSFDVIWVTSILESHIQGRKNREKFFSAVAERLNPGGVAVVTPLIRKLHWRHHYFWSSQILRLRWLGRGEWEPGDVLLSHLGAHHIVEQPMFCHYYPREENFTDELCAAGLSRARELPEGSWIVSH